MSAQEDANSLHSFTQAFKGLGLGIVLAYLALVSFDFGRVHISFMFLPLAAVFLWPRNASTAWSLVFVFILGVFFDVITSGPLGVWGLSYLLIFILFDGGVGQSMKGTLAFAGFAFALFLVYCLSLIFGRLAMGHWPDGLSLAVNAAASLAVFPICYGVFALASGSLKQPSHTRVVR